MAYQKLAIVPLNIINYNLFSTTGGPNLYGTEPASFYIFNGLLAFNILLPLALLSIPLLFVSAIFDPKRMGDQRDRILGQTSPYISLGLRLLPLYLWIGVLSFQAHKEERFLFPAYGLILLNGCTSLYLIRGLLEQAFLKITKSPWQVSQILLFILLLGRILTFLSFRLPKRHSSVTSLDSFSPSPPFFQFSEFSPFTPTITLLLTFTITFKRMNYRD